MRKLLHAMKLMESTLRKAADFYFHKIYMSLIFFFLGFVGYNLIFWIKIPDPFNLALILVDIIPITCLLQAASVKFFQNIFNYKDKFTARNFFGQAVAYMFVCSVVSMILSVMSSNFVWFTLTMIIMTISMIPLVAQDMRDGKL